ncbi:MAG: type II/IV secretion system protein [Candidatus Berkelbacteria bacterium]
MPTQTQNYNYLDPALTSQSVLDVFVLQDLIDPEDARKLQKKLKTNREIENFLLKTKIVTKETINKAYGIMLKLPFIEIKNLDIPESVLSMVPEKLARKYQIIPIGIEDNLVRVATANPADLLVGYDTGIGKLFAEKKLEIELFLTGTADFEEAVKQYRKGYENDLLVKKGSVPAIYLRNQTIKEQYLDKIPRDFIEKYRMVVFGQNKKGTYLIACEKPDDPETLKILNFIRSENNINFEKFGTSREDIDFVINLLNNPSGARQTHGSLTIETKSAENTNWANDSATSTEMAKLKGQKVQRGNTGPTLKDVFKSMVNTSSEDTSGDITIDSTETEKEYEESLHETDIVEDKGEVSPKNDLASTTGAPEATSEVLPDNENPEVKKSADAPEEASDTEGEMGSWVDDKDLGSLLTKEILTEADLAEASKQGSVPHIVAAVLDYALNNRSSDVHVEPEAKVLRIRCRVDGILKDIMKLPMKFHPPFVSRIKIMSKLKIDETRIPQDGRFDTIFKEREVDVRVSTLPTVHGEKIVMRVLDKSQGILSLEDLGMQGSAFEETIAAIKKPYGVILATGPTGSGKSTTLYAVLNRISLPGVNIVTLEDPVEYEIPGINQCQIKPEIGFTFASGLRSILRQDPNVIMVGEIRDGETAGMVTHAALTGHLVLSTLHTNDTAGALPRMINMGVEPFLITSSINLIVAQRLVRRICPKCKEEMVVPQKLMDELKAELDLIPATNVKDRERIPAELKLYHGRGCSDCHDGYKGRVGIYEVMTMNPDIEELAIEKKSANDIKEASIKNGMITMKQDGIIKAFMGETTVDEIFQAVVAD